MKWKVVKVLEIRLAPDKIYETARVLRLIGKSEIKVDGFFLFQDSGQTVLRVMTSSIELFKDWFESHEKAGGRSTTTHQFLKAFRLFHCTIGQLVGTLAFLEEGKEVIPKFVHGLNWGEIGETDFVLFFATGKDLLKARSYLQRRLGSPLSS